MREVVQTTFIPFTIPLVLQPTTAFVTCGHATVHAAPDDDSLPLRNRLHSCTVR